MKDKFVFVDYEGTLSEISKGSGVNQKVLIADLLFDDVFRNLKPRENVKKFLAQFIPENIFVLGVVSVNREIKQKECWLKKHYPEIQESNYIFISSKYKKVEIMNEFVKYKKLKVSDVIFIDDKQSYLDEAIACGYQCINANDIA